MDYSKGDPSDKVKSLNCEEMFTEKYQFAQSQLCAGSDPGNMTKDRLFRETILKIYANCHLKHAVLLILKRRCRLKTVQAFYYLSERLKSKRAHCIVVNEVQP